MGLPRIIYDPGSGSINVDFPRMFTEDAGPGRVPSRQVNSSQGGLVAVQFEHAYYSFDLRIEKMPFNQSFKDAAFALWSHAMAGNPFALGFDSALMNKVTVHPAGAASGQKNIKTNEDPTALSISPGDRMVIESLQEDGYQSEVIVVDSVLGGGPATQKIVAVDNLIYSYAENDQVRHEEYYPLCVAEKMDEEIVQRDRANTLKFRLVCRTVRAVLTP